MKVTVRAFCVIDLIKITILIVVTVLVITLICCCEFFFLNIGNENANLSTLGTMWQVQVTLSTLTIAFASFFTDRLKESHYGLTTKELLCVLNNKWNRLNVYEVIVLIIFLNTLGFLTIFLCSLIGGYIIAISTMVLVIFVVIQSLRLALDDVYVTSLARNYVEQEFDMAQNSEFAEIRNKARIQSIISNIITYLERELRKNPDLDITEYKEYIFLREMQAKFISSNPLKDKISGDLFKLFEIATNGNNSKAIKQIFFSVTRGEFSSSWYWMITDTCKEYFKGRISRDDFRDILRTFLYSKPHVTENEFYRVTLLFLLKLIRYVKNIDTYRILDSIKIHDNECYGFYLHASCSYIYYLTLKDFNYKTLYGEEQIHRLRELVVRREKPIELSQNLSCSYSLKCTSYLKPLAEFLAASFYEYNRPNNDTLSSTYYSSRVHDEDEQAYDGMKMYRDAREYCAFFLHSHYEAYEEDADRVFENMDLYALTELLKFFNEAGEVKNKPMYEEFLRLFNWEEKVVNVSLQAEIKKQVKNRILHEAEQSRKNLILNNNHTEKLKVLLCEKCKESQIFSEELVQPYIDLKFREKYDIRNCFQNNYLEQEMKTLALVFEINAIKTNLDKFRHLEWENLDSVEWENIASLIENVKGEMVLSHCYGSKLSKFSDNRVEDSTILSKIHNLDTKIEKISPLSRIIGPVSFIYFDRSIHDPKWSIPSDYFTLYETLDEEYIEELIEESHSEELGYYLRYYDGIKISCTKEELIQFHKWIYISIVYKVHYTSSESMFGIAITKKREP